MKQYGKKKYLDYNNYCCSTECELDNNKARKKLNKKRARAKAKKEINKELETIKKKEDV